MKRIVINNGFVTNSSSCVYQIDRELLEDPEIQEFMDKHGLTESGYIGSNLWHRAQCESVAVTTEEQKQVKESLREAPYSGTAGPGVDPSDDQIVVVYGDEYQGIAQQLVRLIRKKTGFDPFGASYN